MSEMENNYYANTKLFDQICASGVEGLIAETGFCGYRVVPDVVESELDPYYSSPLPSRAKNSGDFTIFFADSLETCSAELFGNTGFLGAPDNTWAMKYNYSGHVLHLDKIEDEEFKNSFLQSTGDKHSFSQDFKRYITENGLAELCDSISFETVSGSLIGHPGQVYAWHSGESGVFEYIDKINIKSGYTGF